MIEEYIKSRQEGHCYSVNLFKSLLHEEHDFVANQIIYALDSNKEYLVILALKHYLELIGNYSLMGYVSSVEWLTSTPAPKKSLFKRLFNK